MEPVFYTATGEWCTCHDQPVFQCDVCKVDLCTEDVEEHDDTYHTDNEEEN